MSTRDGLAYIVDRLSQTNLLQAVFGSLDGLEITPDSTVAYEMTRYTFTFRPSHDIVENGKISVLLPE